MTSIGANPFLGCYALERIIVSPEHAALATIDGVLFSKADKRLICYPTVRKEASYTVPKGIRIIGDYAFAVCSSLTSITLPESVTSIGEKAFDRGYNLTLTVPRDSYAAQYAKEYKLNYIYTDSYDWLLD